MVSPHFSLEEVQHTGTGLPNEIPPELMANAITLAEDVLEPLRVILGPLHINSWYRSPEVNKAVKGAKNSAHLEARAADILPNGSCLDKFKLALTLLDELPIDQIILEQGRTQWIHVAIPERGQKPRKQALVARIGPNGKMVYEPYK